MHRKPRGSQPSAAGQRDTLVRRAIGLVDARIAYHVCNSPAKRSISPRRRRPAQMSDAAAGSGDIGRKALQADVNNLEVLLE